MSNLNLTCSIVDVYFIGKEFHYEIDWILVSSVFPPIMFSLTGSYQLFHHFIVTWFAGSPSLLWRVWILCVLFWMWSRFWDDGESCGICVLLFLKASHESVALEIILFSSVTLLITLFQQTCSGSASSPRPHHMTLMIYDDDDLTLDEGTVTLLKWCSDFFYLQPHFKWKWHQ